MKPPAGNPTLTVPGPHGRLTAPGPHGRLTAPGPHGRLTAAVHLDGLGDPCGTADRGLQGDGPLLTPGAAGAAAESHRRCGSGSAGF
ncbi:hypothetical protein ABZ378_12755, partial [Streptomyces sp. NPDC005907]